LSVKVLTKAIRERICAVCFERVPEAKGIFHLYLGIIAHQGDCNDVVNSQEKDFSRSKRGRRKSAAQWRRDIESAAKEAALEH